MVESLSNPVQELAVSGEDPPEKYVYKGEHGAIDASFLVMEIPLIDMSLLTSSSAAGDEELQKLRSALASCGCFQGINHGLTSSFLDKVHEVAKQFFALPIEEKQIYSRTVEDIEGYGNDSVLSEHQTLDWTDRLYLTLSLMNELLLKAMARSLNIEEHSFFEAVRRERGTMTARFNLYPPCPRPDLILGVKPHADGSAVTFLLQDREVEGLQIMKDGQWYRVPIVPHALLINVGDQAEIMSNGEFKSPLHRVVTNSERERITLAVFCIPESGIEIGPVEELISENRPKLYKNMKNFVDIYFQNYQQGKRPIDAAKI
ncbi:2-oxoglutarate (2OG) and Fe(II)-dependent oxygenase superfamily protein [Actinidia rufa]|uniref:2-oxoglutarate (2OG) and Fe(II)-dependent oxygenase superfamily protein n=1 Tax=Actinidia rufa TaxID=165716 RepID=A0A7J0DUQ2_9ERIC|nr:2-oxoglutarate (2OG) and Fe(II)-dependent oxygenase superfamily protein [Actinidia rufa]